MLWDLLIWGLTLLLTLILVVISSLIIYARAKYGTLEKFKGLPKIIAPYFIGGSDPFFYKNICSEQDSLRVKEFGPVFGMYEGREPQVFIADPELIRLIYVKDFDHFTNQRIIDLGHPLLNEMMPMLPYQKWKVVRSFLSPQLTTGKIKGMSSHMIGAIEDWVTRLDRDVAARENKVYQFSPKHEFLSLTTDILSRCVFGTRINSIEDKDSIFVENIKKLTFGDGDADIMFSLVFTFPFIAAWESFISPEVMNYFGDLLRDILAQRRKGGSSSDPNRIPDFVDVMNEMTSKCEDDPEYKGLGITETTVLNQAIIFFIAGLETTATALSMMAFHLAKYPAIQERVIQEVDSYLAKGGGKLRQEAVASELVYTAAVLSETLRMHPPSIRTERVCTKDWRHAASGLEIREGTTIQIPIISVHYDPKNYEDPESFVPERWLPENKDKLNPYAFLAFGLGPHACFGMRLGKEKVLLSVAAILKKYKFTQVPGAELRKNKGRLIINSYAPFDVNIVPRTK